MKFARLPLDLVINIVTIIYEVISALKSKKGEINNGSL